MTTGQTIRLYRKEKGLTQSELAELIGVSMQAVSKWETDAGMPDISQIVPLAKVLNVSTDKLLGFASDETENELVALRESIGHHPVNFSATEAKRIYDLASPAFVKHPTNSEIAFWCLESLSVLIANRKIEEPQMLLKECVRYYNCISRYETDPDIIFKSYYVMARCYNQFGKQEQAQEIMEKLPATFGDRAYWEAEFAYADGDMELAIEKCKLSFHDKARYISRCIRLARMISVAVDGKEGLQKQLELNEYMLTLINAFLSGGDYLPHRMMYQKLSLLSRMVKQYVDLGMTDKAVERMKQLSEARNIYNDFLKNPTEKHCLMFPEGDDDGIWHITPEKVKAYVSSAYEKLMQSPKLKGSNAFKEIDNRY